MAIETIKFGRDEFYVKSILAFYGAKDNKGYHVSAHTKLGTRVVCESSSMEKIDEIIVAINGQLKMVGLDNFAFVNGHILNIDEVKHVDLEHTPWLPPLSKQVVATFRDETKLTLSDDVSYPDQEQKAREMIADYDRQKHEYRTAQKSVDLNESIATPAQDVQVQ